MRIGPRLFLAVLPAVLGVVVVVALAYFGEYGRQAPAALVAIAAGATIVSLVVSWRNTRWLARRINETVGILPHHRLGWAIWRGHWGWHRGGRWRQTPRVGGMCRWLGHKRRR